MKYIVVDNDCHDSSFNNKAIININNNKNNNTNINNTNNYNRENQEIVYNNNMYSELKDIKIHKTINQTEDSDGGI